MADLRKKTPLCSKRKARTSWDIHTVTRNAHQLYNTISFISAQIIHFTRPNGDLTFIQTSRSHKMLNSLCQLSWAICSKRSLRSVLAIVRWERLFRRCCKMRCFDFGRFLHVKRVVRARWGVFVLQEFEFLKECWLVWSIKRALSWQGR